MTLREAKDTVATLEGFKSWNDLDARHFDKYGVRPPSELYDQVSRLYARAKWEEACEAQRFYVQEYLSMRRHNVFVDNIAKPEFKP